MKTCLRGVMMLIVIVAIAGLMGTISMALSGCEKTEPVECGQCIALQILVEISTDNVERAIEVINKCLEADSALLPDPNEPPQYGSGDPPAEYQEYFGNDNGARLDFMQNKAIGELAARIERLENKAKPAFDVITVPLTETSEVKPVTHKLMEVSGKPRIYKDSESGRLMCSKHGDISSEVGAFDMNTVTVTIDEITTVYCHECWFGTQYGIIAERLEGLDPNGVEVVK